MNGDPWKGTNHERTSILFLGFKVSVPKSEYNILTLQSLGILTTHTSGSPRHHLSHVHFPTHLQKKCVWRYFCITSSDWCRIEQEADLAAKCTIKLAGSKDGSKNREEMIVHLRLYTVELDRIGA